MSGIARQTGRSKSTISEELQRNSGGRGYGHKQAQRKAERRRHAASAVPRKLSEEHWERICEKLRLQWSPEQIAGWLRREGIVEISVSRIYARIWQDRAAGGHLYLPAPAGPQAQGEG